MIHGGLWSPFLVGWPVHIVALRGFVSPDKSGLARGSWGCPSRYTSRAGGWEKARAAKEIK